MNVTDIKPSDIITHLNNQNKNYCQATGLNALIFLALREQTTVAHQHKELGFDDIPEQIIAWCDCLDEYDLTELAAEIANGLWDENIAAALVIKISEPIAVQAI
ncbi:hypothetical protein [Nostoc sp.]|uniref:hypothetical protein n=1 Tax=Nostoc sp. TaxID=1180 RepID=UPI002FF6DCB0